MHVATLRPATPADEPFEFQVYASTRVEELAVTGWDDSQIRAFLSMQFRAQTVHYATHFPAATRDIILVDGKPAGRLIVERAADHILIVDVALVPEFRGKGVGGSYVRSVQEEAARAALPVVIHVEKNNPALRLYDRLGFRPVADLGIYLELKWAPPD